MLFQYNLLNNNIKLINLANVFDSFDLNIIELNTRYNEQVIN